MYAALDREAEFDRIVFSPASNSIRRGQVGEE